MAQPITSPGGEERQRSASTVEASVAQLSAAINHAFSRKDTLAGPRFRTIPAKQVNRTPEHRADLAQLAAMFRYRVDPQDAPSDAMRKRWILDRASLHRFLIASVATLGRPDAVHDISTEAKRRQWNRTARVLNLNPAARRQTKKHRSIVPIAWQVAHHFDATRGFFVQVKSVRRAWEAMAEELCLPGDREGGFKLIRRSMAKLLRDRLPADLWIQVEMMLGHRRFDTTSDIYAPFDPNYLGAARTEIEAMIDEIEALAPGAFSRSVDGEGAKLIPIRGLKSVND